MFRRLDYTLKAKKNPRRFWIKNDSLPFSLVPVPPEWKKPEFSEMKHHALVSIVSTKSLVSIRIKRMTTPDTMRLALHCLFFISSTFQNIPCVPCDHALLCVFPIFPTSCMPLPLLVTMWHLSLLPLSSSMAFFKVFSLPSSESSYHWLDVSIIVVAVLWLLYVTITWTEDLLYVSSQTQGSWHFLDSISIFGVGWNQEINKDDLAGILFISSMWIPCGIKWYYQHHQTSDNGQWNIREAYSKFINFSIRTPHNAT